MTRVRRRLALIGTVAALATMCGPPPEAAPAAAPETGRPAKPRAFLIYLIDGGDPIVVQKYVEEAGQVRFEKYGGWVGIPRYEVTRIVPEESEDTTLAQPPSGPATGQVGPTSLYVATRSGANLRASAVDATGSEVRVSTPEGSLSFHRADLVGVLRVPAAPAPPEAWITLWGGDGSPHAGSAQSAPDAPREAPLPALTDRPHLLQLANGVVVQVDGFWMEAGEIRFRRLGGVVGFALGEIARLLPQDVEPFRNRLPARFVRRLDPALAEVRLREGLRRVRLIGIEPVLAEPAVEDPWSAVERGLLVHLEFDRERYGPDGAWLAYVYLPNGRMLNAELVRLGLARPRSDGRNLRYLDLFEDLTRQDPPRPRAP
jgi:hypothetical protein